jgi:hypothetical protein
MVGQQFGSLSVLSAALERSKIGEMQWNCQCECGAAVVARGSKLRRNESIQCSECAKKGHGKSVKSAQNVDLSGQQFNKLLVLERDLGPHRDSAAYWNCRCECGGFKVVRGNDLRHGRIISCGCAGAAKLNVWNNITTMVKAGAVKRGHSFSLMAVDVKTLCQQNCHYCGTEPAQPRLYLKEAVLINGIDRINSDLGYELGNVVPCCKHCNFAKGTKTYEEFREWLGRAYHHFVNVTSHK